MEGWGREMEYHIESFFTYGRKGVERWNIIVIFYLWKEGGREMEYDRVLFYLWNEGVREMEYDNVLFLFLDGRR